MPTPEALAEQLADDVLAAVAETGDDNLVIEINKILEAASTTMQEAYMTAIRVRRAEAKARQFLEARLKKVRAARPAPVPPTPAPRAPTSAPAPGAAPGTGPRPAQASAPTPQGQRPQQAAPQPAAKPSAPPRPQTPQQPPARTPPPNDRPS
ncbi:MAG: hypothetical protein OEX14_00385 [Paracoccaceae bacterium]|nr:hypothetical protein [Paracoccaceae bacterium]